MDFLEYPDIYGEVKGAMTPGRLKLTDQHLIFKNQKTGKVEQLSANDMEMVNYQKFVGTWGLRIFLKNGQLHRYRGFKESDLDKIAKFFSTNYKKDMLEKELSLKGWNWGTAKFNGSVLSFDVGTNTAFEIPLHDVSQCTTGKNEVTLEFHQNDDAPVSLMEMRFHIPTNDSSDQDPVEQFHQRVMENASVISVSGDAIAIFREIQCLTPRGRYDIKIFQTFFQLHGKTFDYKIPMSTVLRLFLLPHKDNRQMFFVVSLDPPIKQGQTRYHYLVLLFNQDDETSIELPFTDKELKEKYDDKLTKEQSGPTYEVLGKVMKVIINRKLTGPGNFVGHSNTPAIGCSYKAAAGYLYPLERGFIYVHKPPIHIRFEEISCVNFARGGGSTRSFDFEIELTSGVNHTFSSIEKEEYGKLYDFITNKKLRVKNRGKGEGNGYNNDFGDSDQEEPDAYLERVKAEAKERDDDDDAQDSEDDESTDEDFNPTQDESDVAEEYDSNPATSDDSDDDDNDAGSNASGSEKKDKKHKKKSKSAKTVSEKPRKPRKQKKEKDENKPKRPATGFMLWLNASREQIKKDNPGISVTEIAKKGGELWKELKDKTEWEQKSNKLKKDYAEAMKEYEANGGGKDKDKSKNDNKIDKKKKEVTKKKDSLSPKTMTGSSFKSKEYISDDDSTDDDKESAKGSDDDSNDDKKKKKSTKRSAPSVDDKKSKKNKKETSSEEEEEEDEDDESADSD